MDAQHAIRRPVHTYHHVNLHMHACGQGIEKQNKTQPTDHPCPPKGLLQTSIISILYNTEYGSTLLYGRLTAVVDIKHTAAYTYTACESWVSQQQRKLHCCILTTICCSYAYAPACSS